MIDKNCAWSLDTTSSKSRGISITLDYPYSSGSPAPFSGSQVVKGRINTHCPTNTGNNGVDVGDMTFAGQTLVCPINVAFYYNSVWYNIGLNPFNWPETTMAQVTCTGASSGHCNAWTILPDPDDIAGEHGDQPTVEYRGTDFASVRRLRWRQRSASITSRIAF